MRAQITGKSGVTAEVSPNGGLNVQSSSVSSVPITPNDVTTFPASKGLYVGATGDVVVTMADGNDSPYKNLSGGMIHPISCIRVKATGTTATNIKAEY